MRLTSFEDTTGSRLISSYLGFGSLVYDRDGLVLLSDFVLHDSTPEFSRKIKLELVPRIPDGTEISGLTVNELGSRVCLWGPRAVFVVRLPNDFWLNKHTLDVDREILRSEYLCENRFVHSSLFSTPRPPHVLRAKWQWKYGEDDEPRDCLGLLFSDAVIRVYAPEKSFDYSAFKITILAFHDLSFSNTVGLVDRLVSFDFTPPLRGDSPGVVAMDSCGRLYWAHLVEPSIVVAEALSWHSMLRDDEYADLTAIRHTFAEHVFLFAIATTTGRLTHAILLADDTEQIYGYVNDVVSLPSGSQVNYSDWRVNSEVAWPGSYFAWSPNDVFFVDLVALINQYRDAILEGTDVENRDVSQVHHVFAFITQRQREEGDPEEETSFLSSMAVVAALPEERDQQILLVALPWIASTVLRTEVTKPSAPPFRLAVSAGDSFPSLEVEVNNILTKKLSLPTISFDKNTSEELQLASLEAFCEVYYQNVQVLREAAVSLTQRLMNWSVDLEAMEVSRQLSDERVLRSLAGFEETKMRLDKLSDAVAIILQRLERMSMLSQKNPLTETEKKMLAGLKEYRKRLHEFSLEIPKLSLDTTVKRRELFGPLKSFEPSPTARLTALKQTGHEIAALERRHEAAHKQLEELEKKVAALH